MTHKEKKPGLTADHLETMWNTIPVLISYIDKNHNFAEVNQKFLDLIGKRREEVIGKSCFEVLPSQAAGYLKDDIEVMMTGKAKHNIVETINTKDGLLWIKTEKIPWKDKDDNIIGVICYSFDITEVKYAEEAFKKSDEMLRQVLNTNPNPIFVKDDQNQFILVNQAMADVYQTSPEKMLGKTELELARNFSHMNMVQIQKQSDEDLMTMKERKLSHEREESFNMADGSIKWFRTTTVPLPLGLGQHCLLGVAVDLTESKTSENLLKKQAKELEQSNAELNQFAYVAAHDMQEPLRMVTSYVQLLSKRYHKALNQEANEYIDFAVEGATRIHHLLNDLLAYSQLTNRTHLRSKTNCTSLIERIVKKKQPLIDQTRTIVRYEALPTIHADSELLEICFEQLIDNAIKFKNSHDPVVEISGESGKDSWVFSVKDNGIGFDMQFVEKIFTIFQKLKPKSVSPGTGIGLSICKKIIETHGGRIWADSSPGSGAVFSFSIPFPEQKLTKTG